MEGMGHNSVDLIYLDPSFNSNRDYNAIYKDETGRPLPEQVENFKDTQEIDAQCELTIRDIPFLMLEQGIDHAVVEFVQAWMVALRKTNPALLSYLVYMTKRLL